jgi:hypothetical protein
MLSARERTDTFDQEWNEMIEDVVTAWGIKKHLLLTGTNVRSR